MTVTEYVAIAVPVPNDGSAAVDPEARPCLEVEAPATLPEGYAFDVQFDGRTFSVTVPAGGVKEGQKFVVPHPAAADASSAPSAPAVPLSVAPVGHWKDGLCDCGRFGCCHPACCNAYCCPLILLGQVMTRLKLTWSANEGTSAQTAKTFRIMLTITIGWLLARTILASIQRGVDPLDENGQLSAAYLRATAGDDVFNLAYFVFLVCLAARTRRRLRQKYSIPEGSCGGCDDCCTSFWCSCCAVSQMARHTADYDTYVGQCCSATGLPPRVPALDAMSPAASSIV